MLATDAVHAYNYVTGPVLEFVNLNEGVLFLVREFGGLWHIVIVNEALGFDNVIV